MWHFNFRIKYVYAIRSYWWLQISLLRVHYNVSHSSFIHWILKLVGKIRNKSISCSVITLSMLRFHCDRNTAKKAENERDRPHQTTDEQKIGKESATGRKMKWARKGEQETEQRESEVIKAKEIATLLFFYCNPNNPCAECRSIFQRIKYLCEAFIWIICLTNFYGFQCIRTL